MIDIQESLSIVKYILEQIDFASFFESYKLPIIGGFGILVLIYIIIKIYGCKTRPKENIYDPRCYEININNFGGSVKDIYEDLIRNIYVLYFKKYNGKSHLSYEILIDRNGSKLFVCFSNNIASRITNLLKNLSYVNFVDRTQQRQKFLQNIDKNVTAFSYELSDDYVFPLRVNDKAGDISLKKGEYIFLQYNLRPINTRWIKNAKRYKKLLQKGRDPALNETLLGGCFTVVLPFLRLLADILTWLVHGSAAKTEGAKKTSRGSNIQKANIIEEKISRYGFEFIGRGIVRNLDRERQYMLLDSIQETFECKKDYFNQLIFSDIKKKLRKSDKVDLEYVFMSNEAVDVLNEKEISILLKSFL